MHIKQTARCSSFVSISFEDDEHGGIVTLEGNGNTMQLTLASAHLQALAEQLRDRGYPHTPPQQVGSTQRVINDVVAERQRQDGKWGGPTHDDKHTVADFVQMIQDYAGWARTMAGMASRDKARLRLVQVAALAVAAAEAIDRKRFPAITAKPDALHNAFVANDIVRDDEGRN